MNEIFRNLKAKCLGESQDQSNQLIKIESHINLKLPKELADILTEAGGPIMFDEGAKFKPSSLSGREDPDGYMDLEILYDLSHRQNSIISRHEMLHTQLPSNLLAIGGVAGGDQICLDRNSPRVIYWKHDAPDEESISEIAPTFTDFITRLEPDPASSAPIHQSIADLGILEDESHLDF